MTPCLAARLLGLPVRLWVPDAVRGEVSALLAALAASGPAVSADDADVLDVTVEGGADGSFSARIAGGTQLRDRAPAAVAVAALTAELVTRSPLLCIHAGVVSHGDGAIVFPGASGHGKTTLVAALLQAGFGYVSDEVLAVDRTTRSVQPFRRPLSLAADVWPLLDLDPALRPEPGTERQLEPDRLGRPGSARQVTHVVLAVRDGGPPRLEPLTRGAAVRALLTQSFNHFRDPDSSFHTAIELARGAEVWQAHYGQAPELARLVTDRMPVPGRINC